MTKQIVVRYLISGFACAESFAAAKVCDATRADSSSAAKYIKKPPVITGGL